MIDTDHGSFKHIPRQGKLLSHQGGHLDLRQNHNHKIKSVPGVATVVADALTRRLDDAATTNTTLPATPTNHRYMAPIPTNIDTLKHNDATPTLNRYSPTEGSVAQIKKHIPL
jgi:hypothetical protein